MINAKYPALAIILFLIMVFQTACWRKSNNSSTPGAGVLKSIEVRRYEKALFSLNPASLENGLRKIYPDYRFFLGDEWNDTMNLTRIQNYLADPEIRELYIRVIARYPDSLALKRGLDKVFDKITGYYPDMAYPLVYTYVSGLDLGMPVYYADSVMAIGLDLFLGKDEAAYQRAGIPQYIISRLTPEAILPACVYALSDSIVKTDEDNQSLIDQMVAAGKRLALMDLVLTDTEEENKIGYTAEKLRWCKQNEANIWAFLVGNQLLFSSDPKILGKMMADAPFTSGFQEQSPGRLGEWIGWRIVNAYLKSNPGISIQELMRNTNAREILQLSGYKPRK